MASEMVERLARAIADAIPDEQWDWSEETRNGHLIAPLLGNIDLTALAHAAIKAMREPTERMVHAVWMKQTREPSSLDDAREQFIAGIDAALA